MFNGDNTNKCKEYARFTGTINAIYNNWSGSTIVSFGKGLLTKGTTQGPIIFHKILSVDSLSTPLMHWHVK